MEALRAPTGRFARRGVRDARTLYDILRAVALAAIDNDPRRDPRKVTTRQWRDARHLCEDEFGHIPLPQEIRRQLAKRSGELLPFPTLLSVAFDETRSLRHVQVLMQAEPPNDFMSDRHVWYAMRHVARSLDPRREITPERTLVPREYERQRRALIAADRRKPKRTTKLAARLPTYRQLIVYAGTWDRALEIAQLAPRPKLAQVVKKRSVPVVEAIVRYYEVVGILPTETKLAKFRKGRFAVQARPHGTRFPDFVEEAVLILRERGHSPRPYEETKFLKVTLPEPDGPPDPDAPPYGWAYTKPEIIAWVIEFLGTLGPGQSGNSELWDAFSREHPACPSTWVITSRGGLDLLVAQARHPDAIERAQAEHEALVEQRRRDRIVNDAEKPQALELLDAMRQLGGDYVRSAELEARLGWSDTSIRFWLGVLRKAGKVEMIEGDTSRKRARYRIIGIDLTAEQRDRLRIAANVRLPQARNVLAIIASGGERVRSGQIADELHLTKETVLYWVRKLKEAGYVVDAPVWNTSLRYRAYQITALGRQVASDQAAESSAEHQAAATAAARRS